MKFSKSRQRFVFFLLIIIILSGCVSSPPQVTQSSSRNISQTLNKKNSFPVLELPIPQNGAEKNYLGLSGWGKFKITQIKSPVIIIAVLSTDCPHCRNAVSSLNDLYQTIQARPDLKENIKIIGILDSYASDVNLFRVFRASHQIPFPLFPGQGDTISQKLGVSYFPKFFGVKNNDDGTMEKFYSKTGEFWFWNPNRFLEKIIKQSKLEIRG